MVPGITEYCEHKMVSAQSVNPLVGRNSIDQLLRTTLQHHIFLSGMADRKASFLIAAASVMLTLIFGNFADEGFISIPLAILGGFTLIAAVLAILCITPRNHKIPPQAHDLNLLFFGEFAHLNVDDYWQRMRVMIEDDEKIYRAVSDEIYFLGQLLHNSKFKYLRWAYWTFSVGIVGAALAIIVQMII